MRKIKNNVLMLLSSIVILFSTTACADKNVQFFSISDLHFNPFYSCDEAATTCPTVDKLRNVPASDWKVILTENDKADQVYKKDTGLQLFESAVAEFKKHNIKKHPQFVIVLGDFLSHNFKDTYVKYTGDTTDEGMQSFVSKTLEFTASELQRAFPDTDIFPVVGNNDAYVDYVSNPIFYQKTAPIWSTFIKDKAAQQAMQKEFSDSGYYAVDIPAQKNLRLIVLNTTLFSANAPENISAARTELA